MFELVVTSRVSKTVPVKEWAATKQEMERLGWTFVRSLDPDFPSEYKTPHVTLVFTKEC